MTLGTWCCLFRKFSLPRRSLTGCAALRQPSGDVIVDPPADSTGPRGPGPPPVAFPLPPLQPLIWPHTGFYPELFSPNANLTLRAPPLNPSAPPPGSRVMDRVVCSPLCPALEAPCRPAPLAVCLRAPAPFARSTPIPDPCPGPVRPAQAAALPPTAPKLAAGLLHPGRDPSVQTVPLGDPEWSNG